MHIIQQLWWSISRIVMPKIRFEGMKRAGLLKIKQEYNKMDVWNHNWTCLSLYAIFWASGQNDYWLPIHLGQCMYKKLQIVSPFDHTYMPTM